MQGRKVYKRPYYSPDTLKNQRIGEQMVQADAHKYLRAHLFIEQLRKYSRKLTMQEYKDLRQMALDNDIDGAMKKLQTILYDKATFNRVGGANSND